MPVHESEDFLVQQAIKGNRAAFSSLYDQCVEKVYRHVYYRVSNQADVEDITQEVFVKAWQAIDKYKNTGAPFFAWLIIIAGNLINDYYRKQSKNIKIDNAYKKNVANQTVNPEVQVEVDFQNALVKKAVLKLKGDKQKVIIMRFIDELSYEEIARALHKSQGNIRVIQYRALLDLKRILERD